MAIRFYLMVALFFISEGCRSNGDPFPSLKEKTISPIHNPKDTHLKTNEKKRSDCAKMPPLHMGKLFFHFDGGTSPAHVETENPIDERLRISLDPACYDVSNLSAIEHLENLTYFEFNRLNPGEFTDSIKKRLITEYIETAPKQTIRYCYQRKQSEAKTREGEEEPTAEQLQIVCKSEPIDREWIDIPHGMIDFKPISRATAVSHLLLNLGKGEEEALKYAIQLHQVTSLHLFLIHPIDLSPLVALTNVKQIKLSAAICKTPIEKMVQIDVSFLRAFKALAGIELSCINVSNLEAVSDLIEVEEIKISRLKTTSRAEAQVDISPFRNMNKVKKLSIVESDVEDLGGLRNMIRLKELKIVDSKVSDIAALSGMVELEKLDLSGSKIMDLSPLRNLRSLTGLEINDNPVEDLTPIENLTKLVSLGISNTKVQILKPLHKMRNLYSLIAENSGVKDISGINMRRLNILRLYGTRLNSLRPLKHQTFLNLTLGYFDLKEAEVLKSVYVEETISISEESYDRVQLEEMRNYLDTLKIDAAL